MSLLELPNELLVQLLDYLPVRSLLTVAQTCRHLYQLAFNDHLWLKLCQRKFGVTSLQLVNLIEWNVATYRDLYSRVLYPYGFLLGLWQGEDGVEPYGELLEIKLCSGNMQGWLVRAPALDQLMGPVRYEHLFSLKISDDKQVPRVTCCYRAQKGTDVKITKDVSETDICTKFTLTVNMVSSTQGALSATLYNLGSSRDRFHNWVKEEFPHLDGIWDFSPALYRLLFHHWQFLDSRPQSVQYTRLMLPACLPLDVSFPVSPGLYKGTYSSHGNELILVSINNSGVIQGQKVTGDPNIPAGKLTFQALLQSPLPISQYATWGMAEGCDVQELVKDISCHIEGQGQTQVDVDEILRTLPLCEHPFKVPDGFDSRGQTYPLYSVARFPARGQIAGHGYHDPRWTPAQFVIFADGSFAMVWVELQCLGCYCIAKEFKQIT